MTINRKTGLYPETSWVNTPGRKSAKTCVSIVTELSNVLLRKNTQQKQAKWKVTTMETIFFQPCETAVFGLPFRLRHHLWPANAMPCNPPQTTKFHEAPCHKPPSSMVAIK